MSEQEQGGNAREFEPFDEKDPFNRLAEHFRKGVAKLAIDGMEHPDAKLLNDATQLQAFLAGAMTGVVGIGLGSVPPAGRAGIITWLQQYLPLAQAQAEAIIQTMRHIGDLPANEESEEDSD